MERPDHIDSRQHVSHVVTGEAHLVRQLQETAKLHPPLDTLDRVRIEVGESLGLKTKYYDFLVKLD